MAFQGPHSQTPSIQSRESLPGDSLGSEAAKFVSRTIASSVTARRLLWLCHWEVDMRYKGKLVSAPFKGGKLFGEILEPILVETKNRRNVLPSLYK